MNYIKHLTGFFDKVVHDHSLNPTHISLYISLFQFWNLNRFQNPISITRDEVMRISKICSKATYHKCMREMHDKGYLKYEPSYNPFRGSMVHLVNFAEDLKPISKKERAMLKNKQVSEQALNRKRTSSETASEQVVNKQRTSIGTGTEQALVSSINSINNTNIINSTNNSNVINLFGQAQKNENEIQKINSKKSVTNTTSETQKFNPERVIPSVSSRAESRDEGRKKKVVKPEEKIPPDWAEVSTFFREKNFPDTEAQKFFNHFQSNGWLVGGKSKMKNWKAAARNWMLNSTKYANNAKPVTNNQLKPAHLHTLTQKNYDEPL